MKKFIKTLALALSFSLLLSISPMVKGDTIISIKTIDDLKNISTNLSGNYRLENDIDFGGEAFSVISGQFKGTFNGNGKKIKNITFQNTNTSSTAMLGIFEYNKGTVSNLTIEDFSVVIPERKFVTVGSISGHTVGTISNCKVSGAIRIEGETDTVTTYRVGSIAGQNTKGTIENTIADVNIYVNTDIPMYVGGLVGQLSGSSNVKNSGNIGDISATIETRELYMGGIAGYASDADSTISKCFNFGALYGEGKALYCGGILGYTANLTGFTLSNSCNMGEITYTYNGGGFTGKLGIGEIYGALDKSTATGNKTSENYYIGSKDESSSGTKKTIAQISSLIKSDKLWCGNTGDLNGDNRLTVSDMIILRNHILERNTLRGYDFLNADLSENYGELSVTDLVALSDKVLAQ